MYTIGFVFILFYYLLSGLFFSFPWSGFQGGCSAQKTWKVSSGTGSERLAT